MFKLRNPLLASALCVPVLLTGCGGGNGSSGEDSGSISVGITDGPVDAAAKVVVSFSGITLKHKDGDTFNFVFAENKSIDLLQLQGNSSEAFIVDEEVKAGEYNWMRLAVNAEEDGTMDSYIELLDGSMVELEVPSGAQSGLKLNQGFTVVAGGSANFTIDFDLRKSISDPIGQDSMHLRPTLRLIDNVEAGHISGTISSQIVADNCADAGIDDGAVYIYSGSDVTPQDVQGNESDPLASSLVAFADSSYQYEIGFLAAGEYTIAYTCKADSDDPLIDNSDIVTFVGTSNVTISADTVTTFNFE